MSLVLDLRRLSLRPCCWHPLTFAHLLRTRSIQGINVLLILVLESLLRDHMLTLQGLLLLHMLARGGLLHFHMTAFERLELLIVLPAKLANLCLVLLIRLLPGLGIGPIDRRSLFLEMLALGS